MLNNLIEIAIRICKSFHYSPEFMSECCSWTGAFTDNLLRRKRCNGCSPQGEKQKGCKSLIFIGFYVEQEVFSSWLLVCSGMAMPPVTLSAMPLIVHVIVVVDVVSSDNAPFDLSRSLPLNKWLPIVQDLPPPSDQNLPTHYVAFGLSGTQALPQTQDRKSVV